MSRLRALDKALLATLIPLWVVCFVLTARSVVRPTGLSSVYVSAPDSPQEHPTLVGFRPWMRGEESGLRIGDRLLRLGAADLRGVGPLGFFARVSEEARPDRHVSVVYERAGQRAEVSLPVGPYAIFIWPFLPISLVFALTGVFLLLRAPPSAMSRSFFQAFLCVALGCTFVVGGSRQETYAWIALHFLFVSLCGPLAVRGALSFPHGAPPTGRWARAAPWLLAPLGLLETSRVIGAPLPADVGFPGTCLVVVALFATVLLIATRTYRRADPIERRQIKWAIFGVYCAVVLPIAAIALAIYEPGLVPVALVSLSLLALLPLCLLISVARYNLFDIDRLISATASYNTLLVLLVGAGLVFIPRVADAAVGLIGIDASTGQVALSLLLAAVLVPASRRLRPQIDRLFFIERYTLEQGMGQLLGSLAACRSPQDLLRRAGERLDALLRPDSCAIYAVAAEAYSPVFVRGRAVPPAFETHGPLVAALTRRRAPLAAERFSDRRRGPELSPFDRAALETLGVPVVVPVRRGDELVAFVCLGPKHSGDVYTSTDLSWLAAVADKVSTELLRFDDAEIIRQGRAMQEQLRRYVPEAVAGELESGRQLESGKRDVSVLFVDMRDYTRFSESRRAEEIFSTVNRYTEAVSEVVRKNGGAVVEFNGDGMMAVFGAPRELAEKERAAVQAGRAIVTAVGAIPFGEPGETKKLSVGVGIATGEAFVGNIRAVDRLIWSAIGNTTNLAARLQALTRDVGASMVIDAATWEALGTAREDFSRHEGTPIRGRAETRDVYALPMAAGA